MTQKQFKKRRTYMNQRYPRFDDLESFKLHSLYFDGINLPTKFPCWAWIINYEQINGERRPYFGYHYEEFLEELTEIK